MAKTYDKKNHFTLPPPSLTFLSTEKSDFTYRDLYSFTGNLQHILQPYKPGNDHPLMIVSENTTEVALSIAACFLLKIPVFPLLKNSTARDLEKILSEIKPCAILSSEQNSSIKFGDIPVLNIAEERLKYSDSDQPAGYVFDEPEHFAGYFLTSGSTGQPKIVPVKRRQVFFGAFSSIKNFRPARNKYWLLCLPLNHVGGINVIYRSLLYNSAVFLIPSFDTENVRSLLNENKNFEAASMVPTMLQRLLDHTFFRVQFGFKALLIGGGPISTSLINNSLTRGLPIVTSYGMTETCAQIAANPMLKPGGDYIPKKSVGSIFEPNEIEIRDEQGRPLPYNEPGQIWLKGPQVFDGYLGKNQNAAAFDEKGWFNTGDFGHLNRKKQLFIENRRSDLIITGGENVNPTEIEDAMNLIPGVKESAVIGVPDEIWGQMVVAFVVLEDKDMSRNHIKKQLKVDLQGFKIPKQFISVSRLPKTANEKIKKTELLNWYINEFGK
jgi:O-succinylbenzoic acid--CoA ligase